MGDETGGEKLGVGGEERVEEGGEGWSVGGERDEGEEEEARERRKERRVGCDSGDSR